MELNRSHYYFIKVSFKEKHQKNYICRDVFQNVNSWKFLQVYSFRYVHDWSHWCTNCKGWRDCMGATIFISVETENHAKYQLEYLDSLGHLWWRPSPWSGAVLTPLLPSSSTRYAYYVVIKIISQYPEYARVN